MQLVQQVQWNYKFIRGDYKNVIIREGNKKQREFLVTLCFVVWRERCKQIFAEERKLPMILAKTVKDEFQNWFHSSQMSEQA